MVIDKEYERAIRSYLDKNLETSAGIRDVAVFELNVIRPFLNDILMSQGDSYKFSTPVYAWWDLTSACNFRCVHCLYNDSEYSDNTDLSEKQSMKLADELINDFGLVEIMLTGGEIFLKPYLIKLVKKFKENNCAVRLMTNAALINDKQIEELAKLLNPYTDVVQVSLDGACKETFKKIRRTDLFDKIVLNIEKMVEKGLKIVIACTVNSINYYEIEEIYKLVDSIGVEAFVAGRMLYHNESHAPLMVSNKDLMLLAERLNRLEGKTLLVSGLFSKIDLLNIPEVEHILQEEKYRTLWDKNSKPLSRQCHHNDRISIKSDGKIHLCLDTNCPESCLGDYKKNSLLEIWENRENNLFFQPRDISKTGCAGCKYNKICNSGCMAVAYKRSKSINTPEIECKFCNSKQ